MEQTGIEFVEADEGVGLDGGGVWVPSWVRGLGIIFFDKEVTASPA